MALVTWRRFVTMVPEISRQRRYTPVRVALEKVTEEFVEQVAVDRAIDDS